MATICSELCTLVLGRWGGNGEHAKDDGEDPADKRRKMVVTAHFDNSVHNKYNPAPDREVTWADQSWEEMFVPFVTYSRDGGTSNGSSTPEP